MLIQRRWVCLLLPLCLLPSLFVWVNGNAASDLRDLHLLFHLWDKHIRPFEGTSLEDRIDEYFLAQKTKTQEFLTSLSNIDKSQLNRHQQYIYDVLKDQLTTKLNNYAWRNYGPLNPVNFKDGFYFYLDIHVLSNKFDTKQGFNTFIWWMGTWPSQIDQMRVMMDKAIKHKTTLHSVSVATVPDKLARITAVPAEDSVLYQPFKTQLNALNIPQTERDSLKSRGLAAVNNFWAALNRLKTYMEEKYIPKTRTTYGVYGLPSGKDYYRACVKWYASMDTTPEQVFETGQSEVHRITQLIHQVMRDQGFRGTIHEFYDRLNNNPSFQLRTSDQVLQGFKDRIFNRAYPKLHEFFRDIPQNRLVQVKPMPYKNLYVSYQGGNEANTRPGVFYINTTRPSDTKTFNMMSVALHYTVPGKHLRRIYELTSNVPIFQQQLGGQYNNVPFEFPRYTSFEQGWAMYAEYLGEEMGVYRNEFEKVGRYSEEMLRACRLVVDTGIHYFKWTRNEAIEYIYPRTHLSLEQVESEVDRYITWPGQAIAAKTGELKIKELRKKADGRLEHFDRCDFHTKLLRYGLLPLHVLDTVVGDFIAESSTNVPDPRAGTDPCFN